MLGQPDPGAMLVACRAPWARADTVQTCQTQPNRRFLAHETWGLGESRVQISLKPFGFFAVRLLRCACADGLVWMILLKTFRRFI